MADIADDAAADIVQDVILIGAVALAAYLLLGAGTSWAKQQVENYINWGTGDS